MTKIPSPTRLFVERELSAAFRARWFLTYSGVFLVGGLMLAAFGLDNMVVYGYRGFAKALAGLTHIALVFVPLMALFPATASIAEERESGTLEFLLAQPVGFDEVYAGKWAGVTVAVLVSLTAGFGAAGAVALLRGVPPAIVGALYAFVALLALAFVAFGLWLSAGAETRARAATVGVSAWLGFVALGTLGVMAATVRWGLPEGVLIGWTFINPVEACRIGVVAAMDADLSVLGPVGASIIDLFGRAGTIAVAAGSLVAWTAVPGLLGLRRFRRSA